MWTCWNIDCKQCNHIQNGRLLWYIYVFISTLFENYSKCRIWIFGILEFFTNFCPIKIDLPGNTVWPQASGFQKLAKIDIFWHFLLPLLSTQNVNVARSARNVECDFFCDFQTLCCTILSVVQFIVAKNRLLKILIMENYRRAHVLKILIKQKSWKSILRTVKINIDIVPKSVM